MDRRKEIIQAAENAFLKYGIKKITLNDIALECGINKTALYYYFDNKEDILIEMLKSKLDNFKNYLLQKLKQKKSAKEKLQEFMKLKIDFMKNNHQFIKLLDKEGLPHHIKEVFREQNNTLVDFDFQLVKQIITEGKNKHRLSCEISDSLVLMLLGVSYGTFIGKLFEIANWNTDDMVETSIDVIFNGISTKQE
ncbi:MAG: TetR/AcrR family transcriptional regulator [Candidatus Cloacimonadota bacterium]|nr:TetR/AcrR family transcriptional regulator [Candidatus Cloacimonadota bacterium]